MLLEPPPLPERLLTDDELQAFTRDGVVHVSGVLSEQWIDTISEAVDKHIAPGQEDTALSMRVNIWHADPQWHHIVMNCPLSHCAQQCIATIDPSDEEASKSIRFFYDQCFVKHPKKTQGPEGDTPWHHDITFWPIKGRHIVSVWIALDDTNLSNGGLEFVPGSQRDGRHYKAVGVNQIEYAHEECLVNIPPIVSATTGETEGELKAISFTMKRGDILIFDTKVLHGAPPNTTPNPRRGLALRYFGDDVVMDDLKHGKHTIMAPLNVYDANLRNGEKLISAFYPQVLPTKIKEEVEVRLAGALKPDKKLVRAWKDRKIKADAAAAGTGQGRGESRL